LNPKAPDRFHIHSFAGDNEDECRAHVKSLIQKLSEELCGLCEPEHASHPSVTARIERAKALWQQGTSLTATPGELYFNDRECPVSGDDAIRFHPACSFGTFRVPTVLALITDALTGEPIGVHRTAIKDDGSGKRFGADSKRMLRCRTASCRFRTPRHRGRRRVGPKCRAGVRHGSVGHAVGRRDRDFSRSARDQTADGIC
jgi:hypothetical protein